jgi:tight adherence protein C
MTDPLFIISAGAFVAVVLLLFGAYGCVRAIGERRRLLSRVSGAYASHSGVREAVPVLALVIRILVKAARAVGARLERGGGDARDMRGRFLNAGVRGEDVARVYSGARVLCAVGLPAGFLAVRLFVPGRLTAFGLMAFVVVLASSGSYLPRVWLAMKTAKRKELMLRGLPDALDLLVTCSEAGMGLDSAMRRVGSEIGLSNKVVAEEFGLLDLELRAGKTRSVALRNLHARTGLDEVGSLVALLVQASRFGTGVARALRVHSDFMRARRTQQVEDLAAKLPVKLLFPTVLFIFPSLFLVLIGPGIIRIFRTWTGAW